MAPGWREAGLAVPFSRGTGTGNLEWRTRHPARCAGLTKEQEGRRIPLDPLRGEPAKRTVMREDLSLSTY